MKILSDNAVTKTDLNIAVNAVDEKQTRQIMQLRIALLISFAVNLTLTIGGWIFG